MSGTIDIHRIDEHRSAVPSLDGWLGFFAKSGVFAILFAALLAFLAYQVFMPMQEENRRRNDETAAQTKAFQDAIIKSNEQHAAAASVTAKAISSLEVNSHQTLQVLQQLRDDTRRGAWNEARHKGSE